MDFVHLFKSIVMYVNFEFTNSLKAYNAVLIF